MQIAEEFAVQAFIAKLVMKALNISVLPVLPRAPGLDVKLLDLLGLHPCPSGPAAGKRILSPGQALYGEASKQSRPTDKTNEYFGNFESSHRGPPRIARLGEKDFFYFPAGDGIAVYRPGAAMKKICWPEAVPSVCDRCSSAAKNSTTDGHGWNTDQVNAFTPRSV